MTAQWYLFWFFLSCNHNNYILIFIRLFKSDMVKHELRVTSWKIKNTSWKFKSTSWSSKVRVQTHEVWVQIHELRIQIHELWSQIHELPVQIHELPVQIHELQWKNPSMKTQVDIIKSSSFSKIINPKLFGNSWGNSYVQFLLINSCFKFPLLHGYGFSKKLSE